MRSHKPTTTLIIRKGEKQTELINTEDYEQKMQGIFQGTHIIHQQSQIHQKSRKSFSALKRL